MSFGKFGQDPGTGDWSRSIRDIMEEMQNRSFVRFRDSRTWQPATNVYETPDAYFVCVDLADVDRDDIDVRCGEATRLTISGKRRSPRPPRVCETLSVHVMEIDEGPFRREIDLPEAVAVEGVEASYSKGYLWIVLPRIRKA